MPSGFDLGVRDMWGVNYTLHLEGGWSVGIWSHESMSMMEEYIGDAVQYSSMKTHFNGMTIRHGDRLVFLVKNPILLEVARCKWE